MKIVKLKINYLENGGLSSKEWFTNDLEHREHDQYQYMDSAGFTIWALNGRDYSQCKNGESRQSIDRKSSYCVE